VQTPLASTAVAVVETGRFDARFEFLNDWAPGLKGIPQQVGALQRMGTSESVRGRRKCAADRIGAQPEL